MKTKNLMTAFALSAMFAACTQDVELNEAIAKNDFSNVPMVEAEFTVNTGAESRMATQFGWEDGDIVGLAWMGNEDVNTTLEAWANYPLKCTDPTTMAFSGESMYYVGNYYAYLPYSETTTTFDHIPFSVKEQKLTTDYNELANKMIYITPKTIALTAETAGRGKNFGLTLDRLTNTATINFEFKNATEDLKVTKVELALANGFSGGTSLLPVDFKYVPYAHTATSWKDVAPAEFARVNMYSYNGGNVTLANKDGLSLNADDKLTVYAVTLPVLEAISETNFKIIVTTNKGVVTVKDAKVGAENDITKAKKISEAALKAPLFTKFGQSGAIFATVDMSKAAGIDTEAADQAELEAIITDWITMGKKKENLSVTLKPEEANDDKTFELNSFEIPAAYEGTLTLTVDGTKAQTIVFAGETTINKNINVLSPAEVEGTMTVGEKATWAGSNESVTLTVNNGATLINNGSIATYVVTAAATEEAPVAGKYVHAGEKAVLTVALNNLGDAQWIAGASNAPAVVSNTNFVYAEVLTIGDIKAANKANVYEIHLMDGANIINNTESAIYDFAWVVKCFGDVVLNVTDSYNSNTPQSLIIANENASLFVTEGANLTITSDNKANIVNAGVKVYVEEGASVSVNNVIYNATVVKNDGDVNTYNVTGFNK